VRTSSAYTGLAARVYVLSLPQPERAVATQACFTQLITKESK
jgi:hypothetical protein